MTLFHRLRGDSFSMLLGAMPFLKYGVPIILFPMSFVLGLRSLSRSSLLIGFFGVQYCLLQIALIFLHPTPADPVAWQSELALARGYGILALMAIPFANMVMRSRIKIDEFALPYFMSTLVFCGILGYQFLNFEVCRATVLASNPLIPPFVLVPLMGYLIARRIVEKSASALDLLVSIVVLISVSAFGGNRMAFYILLSLSLILVGYLLFRSKFRHAFFTAIAVFLGVIVSYAADTQMQCGFWDRIGNQADVFSGEVNAVEDASTLLVANDHEAADVELRFSTDGNERLHSEASNVDNLSKIVELPLVSAASEHDDVSSREGGNLNTSSDVIDLMPSTVTEHSTLQRMVMWKNSLNHLSEFRVEWLFGAGRTTERKIANEFTNTDYSHVHNQYLSWVIEGGLVGLLSALLLFGPLTMLAWKSFPVFVFMFSIASGFLTNSLMLSGEASAQMILLVLFVQVLEWQRREGGHEAQ